MVELSEKAFQFLKKQSPIKFLATISEDGYPNVVPVLSTTAWDKETLCFVRFMVWKTRRNLEERKKVSVSALGLWQAIEVLGEFVGFEKTGPRLEFFNNQPLYRYNAYFGAGEVGVIKVVGERGWRKVEPWRTFQARLMRGLEGNSETEPEVMPEVVQEKFQRWLCVKYVSWLDAEGNPRLAPSPGAFPISKSKMGIVGLEEVFNQLEPGAPIAISVLSSEPNGYQLKGRYAGTSTRAGINYHLISLEKSYSAGPPLPGEQIYPRMENPL